MSNSINTRQISASLPVQEAKPAESVQSAPAAVEPKADVRKVAQETFAIKSAVSTDMQRIQLSIEEAVQQLNDMLKNSGRNLNIGVDRALGGPVVVVRSDSGEVVRQIPNETVVKMAHSIEAFKGWLHDAKV